MSQPMSDDVPPPVPARAPQRDSQGSPQISPVQPARPTTTQTEQTPPAQPAPAQTAPAHAVPNVAPMASSAAPAETVKTKREELAAGDAHWQWKIGLRVLAIIVGLIGIGAAAWITSRFTGRGLYTSWSYYLDDGWSMPWTLITFTLSVIWSAVCIIVFFTRRANAPVHPGAQVGVDLILWLAFIVTGLFAVVGTVSLAQWGSNDRLGSSYSHSSSGYYVRETNNDTWVWHSSQYSSYYGEDRPCNGTGSSYTGNYMFSSCEQEDAFVNALYKEVKGVRYNVNLTATVCQFFSLALHLTLFIWACVDTHYRRTRHVTKDAEKLAADIVMNMVRSGAIIPPPGQAHYRPIGQPMPQMIPVYPQYPQQYQQQNPGQYPHPIPQQMPPQGAPAPAAAVASSSNEKGAGPRYA